MSSILDTCSLLTVAPATATRKGLRKSFAKSRADIAPRLAAIVGTEKKTHLDAPSDPLDVLNRDISYLEDVTGVPLLESVVDAHDQLVCLLNPLAAEERHKHLEKQVASLQRELDIAHTEVHDTEERLSGSIAYLSDLEQRVKRLSDAPAPAPAKPEKQRRRRSSGLESTLNVPNGLKEHWHPVCFSSKLPKDMMVPVELFEEDWVVFRDETGAAACLMDECAHRACPLSAGTVVDGQAQCPYHGWKYNGAGECTKMPSTVQCKGVGVKSLPVVEQDGLVWVYPGVESPGEVPTCARPPPGFEVHSELLIDVPVEHGLLLENLLDLAHAPFTHTSTFAKGWPIPDIVKFKANQMLSGNWEPYPIDMAFEPPCMVLSTIGLARPGQVERGVRASHCQNHLHQVHVCLPSSEGRTTLLYRMSMDFMGWTKHVPFIQRFWSYIADQVLGEDLVLVKGQQDRLSRGGDVWANPMPYDKLGVRYRRWRNAVGKGDRKEQATVEQEMKPMSAGELFAVEET
ncbi:hypothetical protein BSKO_08258 [Bryopsis sp. KO-2023]|nr:hypothetical protein BSKO_08258 [Bryopsis sp. KO-2023]